MTLDIDTIIFVGFLLTNLIIGLSYSRGIKTIKEYSIGTGFRTSAITSTVIATYIGAGFITAGLTESYRQGLYFIIPVIGEPLALVITGYFLIPRMTEFLGKTSVAEAMGSLYGKSVRVITALTAMFHSAGIVALQFKVASFIMQLFFGVNSFYALVSSAVIIILYSSLGGIKAVVFTDMLQFFTFGVIMPIICLSILRESNLSQVVFTISSSPLFDFKEVLSPYNSRFIALICLFLYFAIPSVDPAYFQRISMSKGVSQGKKSFVIAGCCSIVILLIVCWTSILLLSNNPNLNPNNLLTHIIEAHTFTGLKGLTAIGLMAAIMSTADSYLNSAAVLFVNDIIKPFKGLAQDKEVIILKCMGFIIGSVAFVMASCTDNLFQLLVMTMSLYMPVISVPLLLAIFGFRSSTKVVLIGMIAGIVTVFVWSDCYRYAQLEGFGNEVLEETNEAIPGMLANLVAFIIAHLLCGRPKWRGEERNNDTLKILANNRKRNYSSTLQAIKNFNFLTFCRANNPKSQLQYFLLGLFSLISIFFTMHIESIETLNLSFSLQNCIYYSALIISMVLMTYPIWSLNFRSQKLFAIFWTASVSYLLVFIPMTLMVISDFGQFELMIFIVNIIILTLLMRWQVTLCILILGTYLSIKFCTLIMLHNNDGLSIVDQWTQYKIVYAILFISAIIIAFLKPKQEEQELVEEKLNYLSHEITDQKSETSKAIELKNKFLRNLQHETNAPLTGVYSMSQALDELYDKLTDEQRKAAIHTIYTSSERLTSYFSNLIDLSKLSGLGYELRLSKVNLSKLLDYTLAKCQKLYISHDTQDDREFVLDIEPDITVECDEYYIGRAMENIITNAIQYCKKGQIIITLKQMKDQNQEQSNVIFSVKDSGIGIPTEDLHKIFDSFTTSTRTDTPAGGRGVGLTLAKTAIELHKGNIACTSDGQNGSCFTLTIPVIEPRLFT